MARIRILQVVLLPSALLTSVAEAGPITELFLSEYIEGTSFNKAIEIFNGTGSAVNLGSGGYTLELYSNGAATASQTLSLKGNIQNGDVFVLAHPSADTAITDQADVTSGSVINFNGDDAVVLRKGGVVIDAFGQIGVDPGSQWTGGGQDDTLRRKSTVSGGDTNATDPFDASTEWDVFALNTFDGLGSHTTSALPVATTVIAFDLVNSASQNLIDYTNVFTDAFSSAADGFQIYQRGVSSTIPFAVLDDSLAAFPADSQGVIDENNTEAFFGVADTENGDNPSGDASATWSFDIAGFENLVFSVDLGAMGDFENADMFGFEYQIDGGGFMPLLSALADEALNETYTMAGGAMFPLDDPLQIDGALLSNRLQTFSSHLLGTGSVLDIRFSAHTNGSDEGFAFQNLIIEGTRSVPEPATLGLLGLGLAGLGYSRRKSG